MVQSSPSASLSAYVVSMAGGSVFNSLIIVDNSIATGCLYIPSSAKAVNCTIVRPSNRTSNGMGIKTAYGTAIVRNCAIFGFNTTSTGTFTADGHNVTDFTDAPGSTSNQISKVYTNQFVNSSTASGLEDFRIVSSASALYNSGVTDTTDIPTGDDIAKTARPQGGTWDVGAWELVAAAAITGTIAWTEGLDAISAFIGVGSPAATIAWTEGADLIVIAGNVVFNGVTFTISWAEGPDSISILGHSGNGVITTPVLKNNTGSILSNETGVVVNVYSITTGALIVRKTGLTSDVNGIVTITDPLLVYPTSYAYEVVLATNGRRLPVAATS